MTYANGVHQRQIGPRNSLDYWNKSEDWQGVTTYYRGSPVMSQRSPYGMENIYAQTPRVQRPAPFPLNLPVSKAEPRRMPLSQRSPSAPETGNYQNVPPMARIRQQQQTPQTVKVERKPSPPKDSPIFSTAKPQPLPENSLIWSVGSHHHHLHNNHVAPISNSPQITRVEVRPQSHPEKLVSAPPSNPALLITQVQKNGTTAGSYPSNDLPITQYQRGSSGPVQISDTTTKPVSAASPNEYSPAPAVISQISPKTGERHLLPQLRPADSHKKCLIIDLDETLVHSSFKPVKNADFVIPVEIDGVEHKVYVLKRPYVDEFLERVGERFECVLFTASLAKYADPVADLLDKRGVFRARLFREACVYHKGNYVKDLARLGRDLHKTIIIDNSPASYAFHPENALPVQTWFDDPTDCELLEIIPLLERMDRLESVYHATTRNSESPTHILERS